MAKRMIKGKFPVQQILGVVAGSVAATYVGNIISKNLPDTKDSIKALIPIALGTFLAMQKNEIVKGAGFGMVAAGGSDLVNALMPPKVTGVDDYFMNGDDDFMNGDDDFVSIPADQSILSIPADQSILSGFDDEMMNGEEEYMNAYDGGSYED